MKMLILLSCIAIFSSFSGISEISPGDPIPGLDVKVGRKPPGGNAFIAETVSAADGSFKFRNLTAGDYSYFVEFNIKEGDMKEGKNIRIEDIILPSMNTRLQENANSNVITKQYRSAEYGVIEITIRYNSRSISGSINKFVNGEPTEGIINKSRSNIKG